MEDHHLAASHTMILNQYIVVRQLVNKIYQSRIILCSEETPYQEHLVNSKKKPYTALFKSMHLVWKTGSHR